MAAVGIDSDGNVYAGLDYGHFGVKMHRSTDGGKEFEEVAVPVYPEQPAGEDDPTRHGHRRDR